MENTAIIETVILSDGSRVFNLHMATCLEFVSERDADEFENAYRLLIERHTNNSLIVRHLAPVRV